jgi:hypothetical protein
MHTRIISSYTINARKNNLFDKRIWGGNLTTPEDKAANKINPLTKVKGYD